MQFNIIIYCVIVVCDSCCAYREERGGRGEFGVLHVYRIWYTWTHALYANTIYTKIPERDDNGLVAAEN